MAKKTSLDLDIGNPSEIGAPPKRKPRAKTGNKKVGGNTTKAEAAATVDLNFKVSAEFKREFKMWAASHDMSQKAVLEMAFDTLKRSKL